MLLQSLIRFVATVLVIFLRYTCQALDNGLALTPPLGISTWSIFRGNINHTLVVDLADSMVRLGLRDVGFEYLMVDAGWSTSNKGCKYCLPNRDEAGNLLVDSVKFPNLTSTIDQVHSKGLLFGIWFGVEMCADTNDGQQGTTNTNVIDYAEIDAQFFASIGVDAIKHDNCNSYVANTTKGITGNFDKYQRMSRALNRTGRPILYDVTLQVSKERTLPAYDYNYIWSPEPYGKENVQRISNMWWSVPVNKFNCYRCCVHPNEFVVKDDKDCDRKDKLPAWRGLLPTLDVQDSGKAGWKGHWDWAGRGLGWNHLDQLSVCVGESWYGPGLTSVEQVSQISLWVIVSSPIIVSVDVRAMVEGDFCHSLITNPLLIKIHRDPLGRPGRRLKNIYSKTLNTDIESQLWVKPLSNSSVAVVFFNRDDVEHTIQATFEEVGLPPSVTTVTTTDVWTGKITHGVTSHLKATSITPHGVTFLLVSPFGGAEVEGMTIEKD